MHLRHYKYLTLLGGWLAILGLVLWQLLTGLFKGPFPVEEHLYSHNSPFYTSENGTVFPCGTQQPSVHDWFDREKWTTNPITNSCFVVENVCHSADSWFYTSHSNNFAQQPNIILDLKYDEIGVKKINKFATVREGYPAQLHLDHLHDTAGSDSNTLNSKCAYSPIPNHFVIHGHYNHMLGEFYERCLIGLVENFLTTINVTGVDWTDLSSQTQLYLHLNTGSIASMLTSHRLLLGALSTNPVNRLEVLLDGTQCQCMKRVIFCGYKELDRSEQNVTLRPKGNVGVRDFYYDGKTNQASPLYNAVRTLLRQRLVESHPSVKAMIRAHRTNIIKSALSRSNRTVSGPIDDNEWKIIGFSQRSQRRQWKNLDAVLEYCRTHYTHHNVACYEINLEEPSFDTPLRHVQAHASLDALIGIHGASLTEAVLMPPHSVVVELLPWLYRETTYGRWTTWVDRPTPLGVIFSETDLVHVGVPLQRKSSVDQCNAADNVKRCFARESNQWDSRRFEVDPQYLMEELVDPLIVNKSVSCQEWLAAAGEKVVLYNVPCRDDKTNRTSVHHYYRKQKWIENIQNT